MALVIPDFVRQLIGQRMHTFEISLIPYRA